MIMVYMIAIIVSIVIMIATIVVIRHSYCYYHSSSYQWL